MSSIAAASVGVVLNLLLGGPFGVVGAGVALLAAEVTVLCIELWCARDHVLVLRAPSRPGAQLTFNAIASAVSSGCAWLLTTTFSSGPGPIAIAGLLTYGAVDIAVAVSFETKQPSCWSIRPVRSCGVGGNGPASASEVIELRVADFVFFTGADPV